MLKGIEMRSSKNGSEEKRTQCARIFTSEGIVTTACSWIIVLNLQYYVMELNCVRKIDV